jgi:hypothetical protein
MSLGPQLSCCTASLASWDSGSKLTSVQFVGTWGLT